MSEKGTKTDERFRAMVTESCGGINFDAPSGSYSFSAILAEERKLAEGNLVGERESALLCLSVADPTGKMHADAVTAGHLHYVSSPDATRYTDNRGIEGTHEAIAEYLNRRYPKLTIDLTPDWVQYSPGAIKRALAEYIPTGFFNKDTNVIFPSPGYGVIASPMNLRGANVTNIAMVKEVGGWKIPLKDPELVMSLARYNLRNNVVYVNMPHNPTGSAFTAWEWEALIDWAIKNNVLLVVDEAYTDIRYSNTDSVLNVTGWEECCIVLQSISKGWSATGLRFGWMIGHPTAISILRKVMDVKDSGMFGLSIAMGLKCLRHPEWAAQTRRMYYTLHRLLYDGLIEAGFNTAMPDAGLCQFTPAPKAAGSTEFKDVLECAKFFREKLRISLMHYTVNDAGWLRWAITIKPNPECHLPDEAAVIKEAVRRIKEAKLSF